MTKNLLSLPVALSLLAAGLAGLPACGTPPGTTEAAAASFHRDEGTRLLEATLYEEAAAAFEAALRLDPRHPGALRGFGEASYRLAIEAIGKGGAALLIEGLLEDAARSLAEAVARDARDPEAALVLAEVHLTTGRHDKARDAALEAARRFQEAGAPPHRLSEAATRAAEATARRLRARRAAEGEEISGASEAEAREVLSRLEFARRADPHNDQVYRLGADIHVLLGRPTEALALLEAGLARNPDSERLHLRYQDAYLEMGRAAECAAAYRRLMRRGGETPLLSWFLGRALAAQGDQREAAGDPEGAARAREEARATFRGVLEQEPRYADSCRRWIALLHFSDGHVALAEGNLEVAQAAFDRAWESDPGVAAVDGEGTPLAMDAFGRTYRTGLFETGRRLMRRTSLPDREEALAFWRRVTRRHDPSGTGDPEGGTQWAAAFSNLGLVLRDLGTAVARAGDRERAMQHWEESYAAYSRAVELRPGDPRIVNDCALVLVYHLHRDWERAEQLLRRAIRLGETELARLGPEAPEEARNDVAEAVGDAWQNLGVMAEHLGRSREEAAAFYEEAVRYFPHQRRQASRRLRSIRAGTAPPAEEAALAAPARWDSAVQDPQDDAAQRALRRAEAAAAQGDLERALEILEGQLREGPATQGVLGELGWLSYRFARQAMERGASAVVIEGALADAARWLVQAVELDDGPVVPRLRLVRVLTESGRWEDAAREADRLTNHVLAIGAELEGVQRLQLLLDGARAHFRRHADAVAAREEGATEEDASEASLDRAREASREAIDLLERDPQTAQTAGLQPEEVYLRAAEMEAWAGRIEAAVALLRRGLSRFPQRQTLLARVVDLVVERHQPALALPVLEAVEEAFPDPHALSWYRGRVLFALGNLERYQGRPDGAASHVALAEEAFRKAAGKPEYEESSRQWRALCRTLTGWILFAQERHDAAADAFLEAVRLHPAGREAEIDEGFSARTGVGVMGAHFRRGGNLAAAERLFAAATRAAPDDMEWANNHGLFARDLGAQSQRQGRDDEAAALFEASYASYRRALELSPRDPRLLNDCALMLVYHLRRDLDEAHDLLRRAIALGEEMLEREGLPDEEREFLSAAVGDAWQNVGRLHLRFPERRDLAVARAALERSLTYPPPPRAQARTYLREVHRLEAEAREKEEERDGGEEGGGGGR